MFGPFCLLAGGSSKHFKIYERDLDGLEKRTHGLPRRTRWRDRRAPDGVEQGRQ